MTETNLTNSELKHILATLDRFERCQLQLALDDPNTANAQNPNMDAIRALATGQTRTERDD